MSDTPEALVLYDAQARGIVFTPRSDEIKEEALVRAALIGSVATPEIKAKAVEVQKLLVNFLKTLENVRVEAKAPALAECQRIDDNCKTYRAEPEAELDRISAAIGTFDTHEWKRKQAEEAQKREDLNRLERERQAGLAAAKTPEEADAVEFAAHQRITATQMRPVFEGTKTAGQTVKMEPEFKVVSIEVLYRNHPQLCDPPSPRVRAIKSAIKSGFKVEGIETSWAVKSSVRAERAKPAIEVQSTTEAL